MNIKLTLIILIYTVIFLVKIQCSTTDGKQHPPKTNCHVIRVNVEEPSSPETMVSNYQILKYHNPEDCNMNLEN
jgi:hypothetical protein